MPQDRSGVVYKGTRFCDGDQEWDPAKHADDTQPPVITIINSSELRGAGFDLQEVVPPALEAAARSDRRTRGVGLRQFDGKRRKRVVLSANDDNKRRWRRSAMVALKKPEDFSGMKGHFTVL